MPRPKFFKTVDEDTIRNRRMTLPLKVGNTYFRFPNHPATIVLYISTTLTWLVNVAITIDAIVNHGRPIFTFYGVGWEQFVTHTELMVGAVILFEIDETGQFMARVFGMSGAEVQYHASVNRMYFKVIIQEAIDHGQLNLPFTICNRLFRNQGFPNAIHLRAPNGLVWTVDVVISQNAAENRGRPVLNLTGGVCFTLTMAREKLERGRVHVPARFDNRHFHTYTQLVQLRLANNEQVWTVEARRAAHRPEMNLSTGWRAFMRDNDIRIGDQCEFEIVDSGPPFVLRVSIMRPNV
ncbi:hypothetical protein LINPERPRIM_LOCUS41181 [Linum perenne]